MTTVTMKRLKLLPIIGAVLLSGCTIGTLQTHPVESEPVQVQESCPSCKVEEAKPMLPPSDCAKAVAVVNYADSCQSCGNFPVTVRAYGQSANCQ